MEKIGFLYGASVQGIQGFIFNTNKLKEIVGASEMVEYICTELFYNTINKKADDPKIILSAAGNIKCLFDDEQKCKDFVLSFPKIVMEYAPGITISQAVVKFDNNDYSSMIPVLENLLKAQRNKVTLTTEIGFMGLERARRTGGVGVEYQSNEVLDSSTIKKINAVNNENLFKKMAGFIPESRKLSYDIEDITRSGKNSWIAVIHADGNGLGQIIQNKGKELTENHLFTEFSRSIERATINALNYAFKNVILNNHNIKYKYPIRPIVIGGDDLTVIIRADLAFEFTKIFLKQFETESKALFNEINLNEYKEGLTACAGIAFIKDSYPLHYGLNLAEQLCKEAKNKVKETDSNGNLKDPQYNQIPKSSLAFYKVQETFIEKFTILKERTLKTSNGLSYYAGPYLLNESNEISEKLIIIKSEAEKNDKSKAVGKLRQIVSETYKDKSTAIFMMKRMQEVNKLFYDNLKLHKELDAINNNSKSQLLDLINLHSFNYGNKAN